MDSLADSMAHLPAALALVLAALAFIASAVPAEPWDIAATLAAAVGMVAATRIVGSIPPAPY